jgi:membrane-bound metal-dependent hydrolase YbcI (DUF457 family)
MMTLNHGLSGLVCGQVAMPLLRRRSPLTERAMGWAFFLGAMLPDTDIVGRALLGRGAYFSGAWYAHRGLSHSVLGTLLLGLLAAALLYRPLAARSAARPAAPQESPGADAARSGGRAAYLWLAGCAWAGGLLHLLGDLFTPGWPLPLFWPLGGRIGGWQHIGWFSPYLLVLFVAALALGGAVTLLARRLGRGGPAARWAPLLAWGIYALATWRWMSFLVGSRYLSPDQWSAYQQALLPAALSEPLTQGVFMLWHWITR